MKTQIDPALKALTDHLDKQNKELLQKLERTNQNAWHLKKELSVGTIITLLVISVGGLVKFGGMEEAIADLQEVEKTIVTTKTLQLMLDKRDIQVGALINSFETYKDYQKEKIENIERSQRRTDLKLDTILQEIRK